MVEGSNLGDLAAGIALATRPLTTRATIRFLLICCWRKAGDSNPHETMLRTVFETVAATQQSFGLAFLVPRAGFEPATSAF
jgi:hypothetical protein